VKEGDSLRAIAAQLLADEERYRDLFDLNVGTARLGQKGPVLQRPELIWPGLRLRLPADTPAAEAPPVAQEAPTPPPADPAAPQLDPTRAEHTRITRDDEPGGGIQAPLPVAVPTPTQSPWRRAHGSSHRADGRARSANDGAQRASARSFLA
jgi:hypothetical protein